MTIFQLTAVKDCEIKNSNLKTFFKCYRKIVKYVEDGFVCFLTIYDFEKQKVIFRKYGFDMSVQALELPLQAPQKV